MSRVAPIAGCLLIVLLGSVAPPSATQETRMATGFLHKTITLDGETYAYSVFVPPEYAPDRPWPAILFLHGSGERGSDGFLQTEVGLGTAIRRNYRRIPAIVVMPQARPGNLWLGPMAVMAMRCLEATVREYRIDPQRIYLTGLSMGGQGVWILAAEYPDRFAAVMPLCGFAELDTKTGVAEQIAHRVKGIPIWCFHGDADTAVPVTKTREMVELIRKAGGNVQYTEYKDTGHGIWDRTYNDPAVWNWLFAQRLGASDLVSAPPGNERPGV